MGGFNIKYSNPVDAPNGVNGPGTYVRSGRIKTMTENMRGKGLDPTINGY